MAHTGVDYEMYLHIPETRKVIISAIVKAVKPHIDEFDGFVIQGYSMSIIGAIVADKLKKSICVVRKPTDKRYSSYEVEGEHNKKWVFLDDTVGSGDTFHRCRDGIEKIKGTIHSICLWQGTRSGKLFEIRPKKWNRNYDNYVRINNIPVQGTAVKCQKIWNKLVSIAD